MTPAAPYDPRVGLYVGGPDFGLPVPPAPPALDAGALELLVRFEHPGKLLAVGELPGAARLPQGALDAAYATPPGRAASIRAGLRERARSAAMALLADGEVRAALAGLPLRPGAIVVALGDSITDDILSWAEILRHALALTRSEDAITVVNAGVSGDTTADALRRLYGIVRLEPDLVITMLGTNDCQRHGPDERRLVGAADTAANLRAIAAWLAAVEARLAWITPPPVREADLAAAVGARPFTLRDGDALAAGRVLRTLGGPVTDAHALLSDPALPDPLLPDGVHPTETGQQAIAARLIEVLAAGA